MSTLTSDLWLVTKRQDTSVAALAMPFCIPEWFALTEKAGRVDQGDPPRILNVFCPDKLRPVLWGATVQRDAGTRDRAERWLRVFLESKGLVDLVRGGDALLPVWGLVAKTAKKQEFYWTALSENRFTCWIVSHRFRQLWYSNALFGALFYPITLCEAPEDIQSCCAERRRQLVSEIILASPRVEEGEKLWLMVIPDVRPNWYDPPPDSCIHCGARVESHLVRLPASEIIKRYRSRNMIPFWFVSGFDIFTCRWYEEAVICSDAARQLLIYCRYPLSFAPAGFGILSLRD